MIRKRLLFCAAMVLVAGAGWTQTTTPDSVQQVTVTPPPTINLLFQVQPKKKTTAAVSEIYSPELTKTVSTTFGGWLTGRLTGLRTSQTIGEPGFDDVNVTLRGQTPLILIDGTPQSFPSINPEQIESITLLKDAVATAMLGIRSSNGAILITTKKGKRNEGMHIEFSARYGIQQPTILPRYVNAYNYAILYNEALVNDGKPALYTTADLEAYKTGSDPIGHPDTDWQKAVLEDQAPLSRYDFSISGGNATTRYYVNLDYLHQEGLLKTEDANTYNTNSDYKRYMIRSNIEMDLNSSLTASLNLVGRIQNSNQPGSTTGSIMSTLAAYPNLAAPLFNSDGSLGGYIVYPDNPYGQAVRSGYRPVYERDFKADLSLRANLGFLLKGLWIKGLAALNGYQRETINRSKTFAVFRQTSDASGNKSYTRYGTNGDQANTNTVNSQNRLFYSEISLGYSKQLGSKDNIDVLVLANNDYRMVNSELPFSYTGLAGKISYDHADKYFVDLTMAYNGTERLPKGYRNGFFPALGLAWNITKESFFSNKPAWLDDLKFRVSAGRTGNDNAGYYEYYQYYVTGSGYAFGATAGPNATLMQGQLANPVLTFEKADKFNTGFDVSLFKGRLDLTLDYFNDRYFDLLIPRQNGSDIFGTTYMRQNIARTHTTGLEIAASWHETHGAFHYFIAPNFTMMQTNWLYLSEMENLLPYMTLNGKPVGSFYGYVADGLFNTPQEVTGHAFQGNTTEPGDIRYKDLNGDKLIDARDRQAIGTTQPRIDYGLSTGVQFKGIDLSVLLQGVANVDRSIIGYSAFQSNGNIQVHEWQMNRWTPGNTINPSYPRMLPGTSSNNNALFSSYWLRSGDYLRVKSIELGYSLPASLIGKVKLGQVRVFVNATNLFTFSKLKDLNIDPEINVAGYPIMKTVNAGITVKF